MCVLLSMPSCGSIVEADEKTDKTAMWGAAMNVQAVSLTEAKKSLGEVVNRAAYGTRRIVLLSRGKPKAALVSLADLEWLERCDMEQQALHARRREALALADSLRAEILARREGQPLPDSVEELRSLRQERLHELVPDLR